jgi:hypothetical protein
MRGVRCLSRHFVSCDLWSLVERKCCRSVRNPKCEGANHAKYFNECFTPDSTFDWNVIDLEYPVLIPKSKVPTRYDYTLCDFTSRGLNLSSVLGSIRINPNLPETMWNLWLMELQATTKFVYVDTLQSACFRWIVIPTSVLCSLLPRSNSSRIDGCV